MNIEALDLNLLVALEALILERSVSKAGARIGLSQPAMSNALARLRAKLGDPLFVFRGREMAPTARARNLATPVMEALSKIRVAIGDRGGFDPRSDTAAFRIAATDYAEIVVVSRLLRAMRRVASGAELTIRRLEALFEIPRAELQDGTLQFALGFFPAPLAPGGGMASQVLFEDPWVCIARTNHPRIHGNLSLETFLQIEHVRVSYGSPERPGLIGEAVASIGRSRKVGLTVPHLATIPAIVARTDLLGIVPSRLAKEFAPMLKLKIFPIPLRLPRAMLALVWHESRQHDPAHVWMRAMIARLATEAAFARQPNSRQVGR
jgi:DNA-binding transcriptional LysR family regulator